MRIRTATPADADMLASLLAGYLREGYPGHRGATAVELRRDVLSGVCGHHVLIADRAGEGIGFVAWDRVYDLHWAASGAQVADLFVVPMARGLGVALELIATLCAAVVEEGGVFLRGGAYDQPSTRAAYARVAFVQSVTGETHLTARAFRHLAGLAGRPAKYILRHLPPPDWNLLPAEDDFRENGHEP